MAKEERLSKPSEPSGNSVGDSSRLVSIIISTFDSEKYIHETLDSILAQSHTNWECVVVDDGSTDNTVAIVKSFVRKDPRIQFHERTTNRPKGGNACRNYGFELSHGQYLFWLDSDDILIPNKIEYQLEILRTTGCDVSVTQASRFRNGNKTPYRKWREYITSDHLIEDLISGVVGWHTSSPLWNRNVIPDRPFNESLQGAQEWFFHIQQSLRIPRSSFHFSDYSTVLIRESSESMTHNVPFGIRAANYLESRTALTHFIHEVDPEKVGLVVDTAGKLLKQIIKDPTHSESIDRFSCALFQYDKPRWMKLACIMSINKAFGKGERLFDYL